MNEVIALGLIVVLATAGYAAGRMHGQFSYRWGFRYGYRQGYFDGDRASWNRRRRDLQAAVASVLTTLTESGQRQFDTGSVYTSAARGDDEPEVRVPEGRVPEVRVPEVWAPHQPEVHEPVRDQEPDVREESAHEPEVRGQAAATARVVPRGRHARMEREAGRPLAEAVNEP